jgi:GH24 family phage-related lysozyme (muramidase)
MSWYKESMFKQAGLNWKSIAKGLGLGAIGLGAFLAFLSSQGYTNSSLQEAINQSKGNESALVEKLRQGTKATSQPAASQPTTRPAATSRPSTPTAQAGFNYATFRQRLSQFEGYRNRVYDDGRGVMTIGIGHAMGRSANDQFAQRSRNLFRQLFGNNVNWDRVFRGRAQLTNDQVNALADADIDVHLDRARAQFPNFNTYPGYIQQALADSMYRGDMGPRTARLINDGDWGAAADEYINRQDYQNATRLGIPGIRTRMNANRAAFQQYARELAAPR